MRARPLQYMSVQELSKDFKTITLFNPNHIKEVLFNCRLSAVTAEELVPYLRSYGLH